MEFEMPKRLAHRQPEMQIPLENFGRPGYILYMTFTAIN